uniref:[histone H3]-lysine(4) N-trimethyltransferase n=1 Tax=Stegastes partitus TaxID=144197 RepID=A0A3B4Z1G7_9TELE
MAPKLERFVSPGKGNGLRATAGIRRGELLVSAEPLACCVSKKLVREVCHHCFTRRETLLRCSQCKMARYCNTTCQKQAWSVHKRECKCLRSLLPRFPTDSVRLAARLIFALVGFWTFSLFCSLKINYLTSMPEQKKQGLSQLASMLELYLQEEVPNLTQESEVPPSCREALSLIAKVVCNCFTITDGELQESGVGLYPSLSLLNHDCRPNCMMVFEGTKVQLRAVQDISPEEEVVLPLLFTQDGLMLSGEEATWRPLKEALQRLEELKADHFSDWKALLESCSCLLSAAGGEVPDENLHKLRITDMALDASIHLQHWEEAMRYGAKTLSTYKLYYPDPHPVHGIQLMRVGKLQHYLEHIEDALDTFKQAYEILKLTHGDDHPMTADLRTRMEECRCEMDHKSSSRH